MKSGEARKTRFLRAKKGRAANGVPVFVPRERGRGGPIFTDARVVKTPQGG